MELGGLRHMPVWCGKQVLNTEPMILADGIEIILEENPGRFPEMNRGHCHFHHAPKPVKAL